MALEVRFITAGCNRQPQAIDWSNTRSKCDYLAYAAANLVCIYDVAEVRVVVAMVGHAEAITSVQWMDLEPGSTTRYLVSGSADGVVCVWRFDVVTKEYWNIQMLSAHQSQVSCVASFIDAEWGAYMFSSASDGTAVLHRLEEKGERCVPLQQMEFVPKRLALSACMARLPSATMKGLVLATGHADGSITLFACTDKSHFKTVMGEGRQNLLLASASQDHTIAVWKLFQSTLKGKQSLDERLVQFSSSTERFVVKSSETVEFEVATETRLHEHTAWVMSVAWSPDTSEGPVLLSAAADHQVVLWKPDVVSGLWFKEATFGGPSAVPGFFAAAFGPHGRQIIATSYTGAFHLWGLQGKARALRPLSSLSSVLAGMPSSANWRSLPVVAGHTGSVNDATFDESGQFFISASQDQTTRVYGLCRVDIVGDRWMEVARPQVHGHDLGCLTVIPQQPFRFASGAAEKVIRVFDAPQTFIDTIQGLCGFHTAALSNAGEARAAKALVPELGLSNKAQDSGIDRDLVWTFDGRAPTESELCQHTLWPEIDKLYGHGNDLVCITANKQGTLLASANGAKTADQASIHLWRTEDRQPVAQLPGHTLTVVQLAFSNDGRRLLSVSRDRHFNLYERSGDDSAFQLVARHKAHSRIIWGCDWASDDSFFVTGSRDKSVKWWRQDASGSAWQQGSVIAPFKSAVTAVSLTFHTERSEHLLAVGLESGHLHLLTKGDRPDAAWKLSYSVDQRLKHGLAVKRLQWNSTYALLSASEDTSVRLYQYRVDEQKDFAPAFCMSAEAIQALSRIHSVGPRLTGDQTEDLQTSFLRDTVDGDASENEGDESETAVLEHKREFSDTHFWRSSSHLETLDVDALSDLDDDTDAKAKASSREQAPGSDSDIDRADPDYLDSQYWRTSSHFDLTQDGELSDLE